MVQVFVVHLIEMQPEQCNCDLLVSLAQVGDADAKWVSLFSVVVTILAFSVTAHSSATGRERAEKLFRPIRLATR